MSKTYTLILTPEQIAKYQLKSEHGVLCIRANGECVFHDIEYYNRVHQRIQIDAYRSLTDDFSMVVKRQIDKINDMQDKFNERIKQERLKLAKLDANCPHTHQITTVCEDYFEASGYDDAYTSTSSITKCCLCGEVTVALKE